MKKYLMSITLFALSLPPHQMQKLYSILNETGFHVEFYLSHVHTEDDIKELYTTFPYNTFRTKGEAAFIKEVKNILNFNSQTPNNFTPTTQD